MRPTPYISSKWPKNSMQFTLGMPFLGVLGKFYRNRKGLISQKMFYCNCDFTVKPYFLFIYSVYSSCGCFCIMLWKGSLERSWDWQWRWTNYHVLTRNAWGFIYILSSLFNTFTTIGLLTRPQLPLVTTETIETLLCSSGPSPLFSSLCFLSSVNYTDWNILHLIWEKRQSQAKPFYLCQWILANSGPVS